MKEHEALVFALGILPFKQSLQKEKEGLGEMHFFGFFLF